MGKHNKKHTISKDEIVDLCKEVNSFDKEFGIKLKQINPYGEPEMVFQEFVDHFRTLLTPGLSNDGTYMTYKYVTVELNADGSLRLRLYCSTTQSGKVILDHKDKDNKPQWYMLLAEGILTDINTTTI